MFRKNLMFSTSDCSIVQLWIISLVVGITTITYASSSVAVTTRNIIAAAGTDVRISCTVISNESIPWETMPFGQGISQSVYDGDKFLDHFSESERFTLDSSRPGSYDLLIRNVEFSDAGSWYGIESEKQSSDLIVTGELACIEKDPVSRQMGENEFGLRQSILAFQCRLNFRGNKSPVFCWFLNGEPMPGTNTSQIADNMSTIAYGELNSVVAVKKLNFAILSVKAVINADTDADQSTFNSTNVSWKSDPLEIRFAKLENHHVKECPDVDSSLMCNPPCAYKQHQRDDGSYYCQANYTLDETNYYLQVNSTCREPGSHIGKVSAVVISAIVTAVVLFWHFKDTIWFYYQVICRTIRTTERNDLGRVDGQPDAANMPLKNKDSPIEEYKT